MLITLVAACAVLVVQTIYRARSERLAASWVLAVNEDLPNQTGRIDLLSAAYRIDRCFKSMEGPSSNQAGIKLSPNRDDQKVLFITEVRSAIVNAETMKPTSSEYFCHANLTLNPKKSSPGKHNQSFPIPTHMDWRLVTLVPGMMDIHLPEGFGLPIRNGTLLDYFTMALNLNASAPKETVRIKTQIAYSGRPNTRALFLRPLYVYQQFRQKSGAKVGEETGHVGAACGLSCNRNMVGVNPSQSIDFRVPEHPGASCCVANASDGGIMRQFDADNTIHWMVPPGKHRYTTDVTKELELPFDTTAHLVTGHLHPMGKALRLVDTDSGAVIFEIRAEDHQGKTGVKSISEIVSRSGIPLRKDGHYELQADYENTTSGDVDAMAIMYLYLAESPDKTAMVANRQTPDSRPGL
ncbi:hypothetical protein BH09VER1_BH09VER1_42100 [soil metagenome]